MEQTEQAIRQELKVLLMYHYGFEPDIADDTIQEVCENLIEQGSDYRKDLSRLAYWKALDIKRRQETRRESPLYEEGREEVLSIDPTKFNASLDVSLAISRLSPHEQEVAELMRQGHTLDEMCQILLCAKSTIQELVADMQSHLRFFLSAYADGVIPDDYHIAGEPTSLPTEE